MKPIVFDYSKKQKDVNFPKLDYDRRLGINFLNGNKFISLEGNVINHLTKTHTQREEDDENFSSDIVNYMTKTDSEREQDDTSISTPLYFMTKTENDRETDE